MYGVIETFKNAITHLAGWCLLIVNSIAFFFAEYHAIFCCIFTAILIDCILGVALSIKKHKFVYSILFKKTATKTLCYLGCLLVVFQLEHLYGIPQTISTVLAALIAMTELWSIAGTALALNPRLILFYFIRNQLIGEIASKLKITEQEVNDILNEEKR